MTVGFRLARVGGVMQDQDECGATVAARIVERPSYRRRRRRCRTNM